MEPSLLRSKFGGNVDAGTAPAGTMENVDVIS